MMFNFARPEVNAIYSLKDGGNPWLIGAALLVIIGPAEEIFWRGTVLRAFLGRMKWPLAVLAGAAVYSLVHILSLNFMLIMAALVCGLFWCLLYAWRRDLTAVTISHCLWDVAVFLIFPI
jgi:membrane protease YdiL (CAAX protease family)